MFIYTFVFPVSYPATAPPSTSLTAPSEYQQIHRPSQSPLDYHLDRAVSLRPENPETLQEPRRPGLLNRFRTDPNPETRRSAPCAWIGCL